MSGGDPLLYARQRGDEALDAARDFGASLIAAERSVPSSTAARPGRASGARDVDAPARGPPVDAPEPSLEHLSGSANGCRAYRDAGGILGATSRAEPTMSASNRPWTWIGGRWRAKAFPSRGRYSRAAGRSAR